MNAAALYGLKQEIQFNVIQSPTRLVAAPVSVWHDTPGLLLMFILDQGAAPPLQPI